MQKTTGANHQEALQKGKKAKIVVLKDFKISKTGQSHGRLQNEKSGQKIDVGAKAFQEQLQKKKDTIAAKKGSCIIKRWRKSLRPQWLSSRRRCRSCFLKTHRKWLEMKWKKSRKSGHLPKTRWKARWLNWWQQLHRAKEAIKIVQFWTLNLKQPKQLGKGS